MHPETLSDEAGFNAVIDQNLNQNLTSNSFRNLSTVGYNIRVRLTDRGAFHKSREDHKVCNSFLIAIAFIFNILQIISFTNGD